MISVAFRLVIRKFKSSPAFSSLVILCLALGVSASLFIVQWIQVELSFDRFHTNHDRIYRLTVEHNDKAAGNHTHFARSWYGWLKNAKEKIPGIEKHARISHWYGGIVKVNEDVFETRLFFTTNELFETFTITFLQGNQETALSEPFTLVLTESAAKKYVGSSDALGKTIEVYCRNCQEKKPYEIVGVVKDMPSNSHFKFDILAAYEDPETYNSWAYHYLLLDEHTNPYHIRHQFASFASDYLSEEEVKTLTPHLQNIKDIHLKSHKSRELEENSHIKNVYMLGALGVFVFVIALFNFINLQYVQLLKKFRTLRIQQQHGSSKYELYLHQLIESSMFSAVAMTIGIIVYELLSGKFSTMVGFPDVTQPTALLYTLFFLFLLPAFSGLLPLMVILKTSGHQYKHMHNNIDVSVLKDSRLHVISKVFVTLQYASTIVLIIVVIVMNRQINHFMNQRLGQADESIVNIENMPVQVIDKYQVFKEQLLTHPVILNVTSSMEDPGDESMDMMRFETSGIEEDIEDKLLYVYPVDDNFFSFYNIRFLAGQPFRPFRGENKGPEDYILNESAVKYLGWKPGEAIGKPFTLNFNLNDSNFFNGGKIVGVVEDFQMASMKQKIKPFVFFQKSFWLFSTQVKIREGKTSEALDHIRIVWNNIYPDFPLEFSFVKDLYLSAYKNETRLRNLSLLLGLLAIILSSIGLLGITGILFQTKRKEIGIRKVNGAGSGTILFMQLREYSKWIIVAVAVASPLAWLLMNHWLRNYAYKISLEAWIFLVAGAFAYILAMITVGWQSWSIARTNPVDTLKDE